MSLLPLKVFAHHLFESFDSCTKSPCIDSPAKVLDALDQKLFPPKANNKHTYELKWKFQVSLVTNLP
jgi:hypothetical protein